MTSDLLEENQDLRKQVEELEKVCNKNMELADEIDKLEKENAELEYKLKNLASVAEVRLANWQKLEKENAELKETLKILSRT